MTRTLKAQFWKAAGSVPYDQANVTITLIPRTAVTGGLTLQEWKETVATDGEGKIAVPIEVPETTDTYFLYEVKEPSGEVNVIRAPGGTTDDLDYHTALNDRTGSPGSITTLRNPVYVSDLPTSLPSVTGQLWNDRGVIRVANGDSTLQQEPRLVAFGNVQWLNGVIDNLTWNQLNVGETTPRQFLTDNDAFISFDSYDGNPRYNIRRDYHFAVVHLSGITTTPFPFTVSISGDGINIEWDGVQSGYEFTFMLWETGQE